MDYTACFLKKALLLQGYAIHVHAGEAWLLSIPWDPSGIFDGLLHLYYRTLKSKSHWLFADFLGVPGPEAQV
jgi:hypothetical protein